MAEPAIRDTPAVRLGFRLRRARLARNMTQSEVAQKQFSVSYISAVERGQIRPSLGALEKLAERLEVPLADLLRDEDTLLIPPSSKGERFESISDREDTENRLREAQILARQGKPQDALALLQRLGTKNLGPREQILLHADLGRCYSLLGRGEDARREIQEAVTIAERTEDTERRARLMYELGTTFAAARKHQLALEQYQASLEAIDKELVRDPAFVMSVLFHVGDAHRHLGDLESAARYLGQAAEMESGVLSPERLATTYAALSAAARDRGDARRAAHFAGRSLAAYDAADAQRLSGRIHNRLGNVHIQAGKTDEASEHLRMALAMADLQGDVPSAVEARCGLALISLRQHQLEDATREVKEALDLAATLPPGAEQGEALLVQAQVFGAKKDYAGAERSFDEALQLLERTNATQQLSDVYKQYSTYLEERGQSKRALELLKKAWQMREHTGGAL